MVGVEMSRKVSLQRKVYSRDTGYGCDGGGIVRVRNRMS